MDQNYHDAWVKYFPPQMMPENLFFNRAGPDADITELSAISNMVWTDVDLQFWEINALSIFALNPSGMLYYFPSILMSAAITEHGNIRDVIVRLFDTSGDLHILPRYLADIVFGMNLNHCRLLMWWIENIAEIHEFDDSIQKDRVEFTIALICNTVENRTNSGDAAPNI